MAKQGARRWMWLLLVLPGILFVTVFMLIPLFSVILSTFFPDTSFSFGNYIMMP